MQQTPGAPTHGMKKRGAAIGTFDGVHRGHRSVLSSLTRLCEEKDLEAVAITFNRHPLALINPALTPPTITPLPKKIELLRNAEVSPIVFEFNEDLRKLTAKEWMQKIHDELGVELLVIGYDNTFGCDGVNMSLAEYREIASQLGMEIVEAPELEGISSSAIRKAILAGEIDKAIGMTGRSPFFSGKVVEGNKLGRSLGFPTANIDPHPGVAVPKNGVYAARATLPDGKKYPAMVNIGTRPTVMRGDHHVIEAHIIGWDGDLYGKEVGISLISRLRDEMKFDSIQKLKNQLEEDKQNTLQLIS